MTHSEASALLGDYLEGDLEIAERRRLDEHLPECPRCSDELRELRSTISLLRNLPDSGPPREFADAVMARIGAGEATAPILLRAFRRLAAAPAVSALAATIAALALFAGLQAVSPQRGTSSVGPLLGVSSAIEPMGSAFTGPGNDEFERILVGFFRDRQPDPVLEYMDRHQEVQRARIIREFVHRVYQQSDSDALRRRIIASKHPLAGVLVWRMPPAARRDPAVIPVSAEVRGR